MYVYVSVYTYKGGCQQCTPYLDEALQTQAEGVRPLEAKYEEGNVPVAAELKEMCRHSVYPGCFLEGPG